jgi:site-specific DNA-methyltransferase (adenine-specific)/adenine-specific DNA-methyltransferase
MVMIDKNYNETAFEMDEYYFAEDLLPKKKKQKEVEDVLKDELKKQKEVVIGLRKKECGKKLMLVYVDIYGNEFKEKMTLK